MAAVILLDEHICRFPKEVPEDSRVTSLFRDGGLFLAKYAHTLQLYDPDAGTVVTQMGDDTRSMSTGRDSASYEQRSAELAKPR